MQKQMKESNKKNSCVFVYIRIPLFRNKEKLNFYIFHAFNKIRSVRIKFFLMRSERA